MWNLHNRRAGLFVNEYGWLVTGDLKNILDLFNHVYNLLVSQPLHIFYVGIVAALNMIGQIHIDSGIVLQTVSFQARH